MKVLFIDDLRDAVAIAETAVGERFQNACIKFECSFDDAMATINSFQPDVVIIDLLKELTDGDKIEEGFIPLKWIWDNRIIPIVVYSAEPDRFVEKSPNMSNNPLVRTITKGRRSSVAVADAVEQLAPFGELLNAARLQVEEELSVVFKEVAPRILGVFKDQQSGAADSIGRATFSRLAAIADEAGAMSRAVNAWEQYLVPVISKDLMVGDVIVDNNQSNPRPEHFRLVLTPSCDLAVRDDGKAKVTSVLVAKCCEVADGLKKAGISGTSAKSIQRSNILSQGFAQSVIPMPELSGVIPSMMVNLRDLELIPLEQIICADSPSYRRVASTDSPFRELVSWAYIQTAGRPGMPDRDEVAWSEEISARAKQEQSS